MKAAPRRRVLQAVLLAALALLLLAGGALFWFSRPERLTPILLAVLAEHSGLQIEAQGPARIVYRPMLRLHLRGLQGNSSGAPVFAIEELDLALPWRTLLGADTIEIASLHLSGLHLHLPAARAWWDSHPPSAGPVSWPRLLHGAIIEDSTIIDTGWTLQIATLRIPYFALGDALALQSAAVLHSGNDTWQLSLHAQATPQRIHGLPILTFDRLQLAANPDLPALTAHGKAQFGDPIVLDLQGRVDSIPAAWPALPGFDYARPLSFALTARSTDHAALDVTIELEQSGNHIRLRGDPERVRSTFANTQGSPLPAIEGEWKATSMQIGGVQLQGLEIRIEPDAQE